MKHLRLTDFQIALVLNVITDACDMCRYDDVSKLAIDVLAESISKQSGIKSITQSLKDKFTKGGKYRIKANATKIKDALNHK